VRRPSGCLILPLLLASCVQTPAPPPAAPPAPAPAEPVLQVEAPVGPEQRDFTFDGAFSQGGVVLGTAPSGTGKLTLDGRPVALGEDGRFILGFDRDQARTALLVAKLADGTSVTRELGIAPRAWEIEHVDAALRQGRSSEAFLRIREPELARINAARAVRSSTEGWRQEFIWPVTGRISGRFGAQRIYRGEPGSYHTGIDIAPGAGAPVVAPADGVVVLAGPPMFSLEGNLVIVDHGMGLNSAFLHLATVNVREDQRVKQGQLIGTVGATGRATGPHLHWSLKWNDARLDPLLLTGPMPG
jgi:murein DD-endopeptidase MepM/ murein hydrolase activator NlpD